MQPFGNRVLDRGPFLHEHNIVRGLGLFLRGLPPPGASHPDMDLADRADGPRLDQLDHAAVVVGSVDLGAHLGGYPGPAGGFPDDARFPHVVGERFFAIDMLAQLQGGQRGKGMGVFAGADNDRIELARMIVEFPEIDEFARLRELLRGGGEGGLVHIAQRHDVLRAHGLQVSGAASARADNGDVEALVGIALLRDGRHAQRGGPAREQRGAQKRPAGQTVEDPGGSGKTVVHGGVLSLSCLRPRTCGPAPV